MRQAAKQTAIISFTTQTTPQHEEATLLAITLALTAGCEKDKKTICQRMAW